MGGFPAFAGNDVIGQPCHFPWKGSLDATSCYGSPAAFRPATMPVMNASELLPELR